MYLSHSHESKVNSSKTNGQGVQLRGNKPITDKDPGGHIFPKSYKLKATPFETSVIIHTQLSLTTTLISYRKKNMDFIAACKIFLVIFVIYRPSQAEVGDFSFDTCMDAAMKCGVS